MWRYSPTVDKEPKSPVPVGRCASGRMDHSYSPPVQSSEDIWARSSTSCLAVLCCDWGVEDLRAFSTWEGERELSKWMRGMIVCYVMRRNNIAESGKGKWKTKGKGDLSHRHHSEHEMQRAQSEEEKNVKA